MSYSRHDHVQKNEIEVFAIASDRNDEWLAQPTRVAGKIVRARVDSVKQPGVTNVQVWGAHEHRIYSITGPRDPCSSKSETNSVTSLVSGK